MLDITFCGNIIIFWEKSPTGNLSLNLLEVMQMSEINKDRLRNKILHSRELTALEKRYLEELIKRDNERRAQHVDKTDC